MAAFRSKSQIIPPRFKVSVGNRYGSEIFGPPPLAKKVPDDPYAHVKSRLGPGECGTPKTYEGIRAVAKRRAELFDRISSSAVIRIMRNHAAITSENIHRLKDDGVKEVDVLYEEQKCCCNDAPVSKNPRRNSTIVPVSRKSTKKSPRRATAPLQKEPSPGNRSVMDFEFCKKCGGVTLAKNKLRLPMICESNKIKDTQQVTEAACTRRPILLDTNTKLSKGPTRKSVTIGDAEDASPLIAKQPDPNRELQSIVAALRVILIDCRATPEYEKMHIVGSFHIPGQYIIRGRYPYWLTVLKTLQSLRTLSPLILLVHSSDVVGSQVASILVEQGYTNVHLISGGIDGVVEKAPELIEEKPSNVGAFMDGNIDYVITSEEDEYSYRTKRAHGVTNNDFRYST